MSEYSITQDQIDALLNEVSIEDRIQNQYGKIKHKISRMLHKSASRELLAIKKDLGTFMKMLEDNRPFSKEFIDSFKGDYEEFSKNILQRARDISLFENVVKLESMIFAMIYQVEQERRRYPRFPLSIDLTITIDGKTHILLSADISNVGMSFYSPVALKVGRRYTIFTPVPGIDELTVDVLRSNAMETRGLNVFEIAAAFPNLMAWERIRDIISKSMEGW